MKRNKPYAHTNINMANNMEFDKQMLEKLNINVIW